MAKLVVFRGDAVENEIRLTGNTVRIGRHNRNDVVLDDQLNGVSRFHAEIRAEGRAYFIVDLNSRNGVWINGRRIKEKAALALGVPVTVGAFELALEDDASSGSFDIPVVNSQTVVSAGSVEPQDGTSRSGTRSGTMQSPSGANRRQVLLWSGAVAALLLVIAIPFAVIRYKSQPAPPVAITEAPPVAPAEPPPPPPPEPPQDPNKPVIEQHLADARTQMAANDFAGALRDHLQPALELDPENAEALALKKQADDAVAAAAATRATRTPPKTEPVPTEVETPGITRRANEAYPDYTTRVRRIQANLAEGKANLEKQEFNSALTHFRAVERDQPRYQGVDLLITDALGKQQRALEEAMSSGQQNEQAGKLRDARLWYVRALEIDPSSTASRERNAALLSRMNAEATKLFDQATLAIKLQDTVRAARLFQQIVDLMLPGDEIRQNAAKQLEGLKR